MTGLSHVKWSKQKIRCVDFSMNIFWHDRLIQLSIFQKMHPEVWISVFYQIKNDEMKKIIFLISPRCFSGVWVLLRLLQTWANEMMDQSNAIRLTLDVLWLQKLLDLAVIWRFVGWLMVWIVKIDLDQYGPRSKITYSNSHQVPILYKLHLWVMMAKDFLNLSYLLFR